MSGRGAQGRGPRAGAAGAEGAGQRTARREDGAILRGGGPAPRGRGAQPGPAASACLLPPRSRAVAAASGIRLLEALPRGVRIGESTVASFCVHILHPADPDTVTVLLDRDAGHVFYGRRQPAQIVHLDVFHAPGEMPPAAVAAAFFAAAEEYRRLPGAGGPISPDAFDLQTAVGGGRLGGSLTGGRRDTVLAAHRGHVHLAGRLAARDTAFCFFLVAAVERGLGARGLSPRKPLRVLGAHAGGDARPMQGLRDYEAITDTWLREPRFRDASDGSVALGEAAGDGRRLRGAGGAGSSQDGRVPGRGIPGTRPGLGGDGGVAGARPWAAACPDAEFAAAARLAEDLGGAEAAWALLQALAVPAPLAALPAAGWPAGAARQALARLVQGGMAEGAGSLWRLTPRGQAMRSLFGRHLREIELALRAAARSLTPAADRAPAAGGRRSTRPGRRLVPGVLVPLPGERWGDIAVPETAVAAAARQGAPPAVPAGGGRGAVLHVLPGDLRVRRRIRPRRVDLCLLLDASASMEGGRMRAAKTLARHLLLTGRGRVAVMAFQERGCTLAVPLTRNYSAAERGLRRIAPAGLTPLAAGLRAARGYLVRARAKSPLLLLVTDGIPTAAYGEGSPLDEALREGERLRAARVSLCCIGLEPNERYLRELAARAGGRLHVVAELRPELLARLARGERAQAERAGGPRLARVRGRVP